MYERGTKSRNEKSSARRPYQTPRLVNHGQVEVLTKSGGNTSVDGAASKKHGG
jgi:hypothetical protein